MTRRLLILAAVAAAALLAQDFTGRVVGVTDGDTIRVMRNGVAERIWLWGIDSPESKQALGSRAKQFTRDLVFGQTVTVRVKDIDRYQRIVAEIILRDGRSLNRELVRAGFAWWYERYARHETAPRGLEKEARAAKRGLWTAVEWRRAGGRVAAALIRVMAHRKAEEPESTDPPMGEWAMCEWTFRIVSLGDKLHT